MKKDKNRKEDVKFNCKKMAYSYINMPSKVTNK